MGGKALPGKRGPQVSPLRCAPVEMTILWRCRILCSQFDWKHRRTSPNRIVISTGAQRSGETCGLPGADFSLA
jgi:hypothetical protein